MNNLIPIRSPKILIRPLDENYAYVVNCAFPDSLRLLNRKQREILKAVDNRSSISTLSAQLGVEEETLYQFLVLLSKTEIIRFDREFSEPRKPDVLDSLNFWIHTTNSCNLTCGYCYIPTLHTKGGMDEAIMRQLLAKLIQTAAQRKVKSIKLRLAGGEPLTQFKAWKIFIPEAKHALAELGCSLSFSFITNLTILTDEIIQFSKDHGIGFGVSLDGVAAGHNATRAFRSGEGSFQVVDRNIRRLLDAKISVSINTVLGNANLTSLPELTQYLIDLNVPFRYSIVKGEPVDADRLETGLLKAYSIMRKAIAEGWHFSSHHRFCDLKPSSLGFQTCSSGFSGGAIYVDGTVNYCHVHFGDHDKAADSIFDEEYDLVDMIVQGSHEENFKSEDCRSCRYRSVCTSGCPVYRVNGKDRNCSLYHKIIPLIYDLQAIERLELLDNFKI